MIRYADENETLIVHYEFDGEGRVIAIVDRDNRRVEYEYTDGLLTQVIDVMGNETAYEYDAKNADIVSVIQNHRLKMP